MVTDSKSSSVNDATSVGGYGRSPRVLIVGSQEQIRGLARGDGELDYEVSTPADLKEALRTLPAPDIVVLDRGILDWCSTETVHGDAVDRSTSAAATGVELVGWLLKAVATASRGGRELQNGKLPRS